MLLMIGLWFLISSPNAPVESAQRSCVPNCVSILELAGLEAAEDLRGLAGLIRDRVKAAESGRARLEILNAFFLNGLRFEGDDTLESSEGIRPAAVLTGRRGNCVGLAGVYIALAQLLELPVAAVSVPNHMFVRFDDGRDRINVELLQAGRARDDDWYMRNHRIPASAVSSGVFLRSLSEREFLGYVYANLGTISSRHGDYNNSRVLYDAALRNAPQLPVAHYNLGNDLLNQSLYRQAIQSYDAALDLYPTDIMALNNRGLALCRLGKARRARRDFQAVLNLDPSFTQARSNLTDLPCSPTKESKH